MSKISEQISAFLQDFEEDYERFEIGNHAAGVRARKALMEIKKIADAGRKEIADRYKKRRPEVGSTETKEK
jgi:DNA-directed RNA polymerase delta subunit